MLRSVAVVSSLTVPLTLAGCYSTAPGAGSSAAAPNASVATWHMPWQLDPISRQSAVHGEKLARTYLPGTGYVRGTREALSSVGRPLPQGPEPNHTVETCRQTVAGEAEKYGAKEVEAASAGVERLDAQGHYVGRVLMRVNYPNRRRGGYDVRETVMTCIVDQNLKIVDAYAAGSRRSS